MKLKLSQIKSNPNNPRIIKDIKFDNLVSSIKTFPEMLDIRPIVVNKDMIVLGGNMRLKACKEAGLKEVPVIVADNLTEEQEREFIIKDNVGFGEWDWEMLAHDWETETLNEWGLDFPDSFVVDDGDAEEDDFTPPDIDTVETDIVKGDIFEIGEHRLLCGDSCDSDDINNLMNGDKARMVFTDPPWNVNYGADQNHPSWKPRTIMNDSMSTEDFKDFMGDAFSMMALASEKGTPTYVVMSAQEWGNMMLALYENDYHWSSTIIWNKSSLVLSRKDYHTKYEPIWYGWLNGAPRLTPLKDRKQSDVWDVDRPTKSELHPTTKPIELLNIALNNSSKRNDLILDLFLGSGSTMVAAHQLKRKCYGMELDPKYCQVIVDRMKALDPNIKIKRNGKELD